MAATTTPFNAFYSQLYRQHAANVAGTTFDAVRTRKDARRTRDTRSVFKVRSKGRDGAHLTRARASRTRDPSPWLISSSIRRQRSV